MDGVLVDFMAELRRQELLLNPEIKNPGIDVDLYKDQPNIFSNMRPIDGAVEAWELLASRYDCHILSTAPWGNDSAWSDKARWVKKYLGESATKKLTISHHKNLLIGDYLIDDRYKNGSDSFTGEMIHFGSDQFPSWKEVLDYLI